MKLFEELTQLHGVSGYETAVADYIKEKLAPLADDITTDPNGSVIAYFKGTGAHKKRIELAAHTDEIGFQVIKIEEDGRIMFKELRLLAGRLQRTRAASASATAWLAWSQAASRRKS